MKFRIRIWTIFSVAIFVLIGFAYSQTTKSETVKTIKLASGEDVFDLNGEWDAVGTDYGRRPYKNVIQITQKGNFFRAIRLQDDPGASTRGKGSMFMQGELDKSGLGKVYYIDQSARLMRWYGQISEDGNEINLDDGHTVKAILTRK